MKILLINNFHYKRGGSETVYFNTADILKENGHEVVFFSKKDDNMFDCEQSAYFVDEKFNISDNLVKKAYNFKNYFYNKPASKNLNSLLLKEKPDIAHIHLIWGGLTSSILSVLKKNNIPIVHTAHDYRLICPAYTYLDGKGVVCESCKKNKYFMCWLKRCSKNNILQSMVMGLEMYYRNIFFDPLKMIDGFIFPSSFSRDKHFQYKNKFSEKKTAVLYNCGDINKSVFLKEDYLLYYGRISPEKGIYTLIEVMKKLPDVKLKIAGSGPQLDLLTDYINGSCLKNIEILGYVQGEELVSLISKAYFVIVPSEWYENNPMTIVESYSYGTPVIGANIGGIPEIVKNYKTGFLFDSHNVQDLSRKIQLALSLSREKYFNMCIEIGNFAKKHFNRQIYYDSLMNMYISIMNKTKVKE